MTDRCRFCDRTLEWCICAVVDTQPAPDGEVEATKDQAAEALTEARRILEKAGARNRRPHGGH